MQWKLDEQIIISHFTGVVFLNLQNPVKSYLDSLTFSFAFAETWEKQVTAILTCKKKMTIHCYKCSLNVGMGGVGKNDLRRMSDVVRLAAYHTPNGEEAPAECKSVTTGFAFLNFQTRLREEKGFRDFKKNPSPLRPLCASAEEAPQPITMILAYENEAEVSYDVNVKNGVDKTSLWKKVLAYIGIGTSFTVPGALWAVLLWAVLLMLGCVFEDIFSRGFKIPGYQSIAAGQADRECRERRAVMEANVVSQGMVKSVKVIGIMGAVVAVTELLVGLLF
ncbi:hypothetical protein COLO4_34796 [Corchorus olitorius]|uniref:Uncharacterized protein n=1 Tax=Corchorus olitorius TaxID=93759 RepID=A0A1R3GJL7_9ROSI|nr:hypothetical protein COLO4_34796 [Corchorus olitorius]